MKAGELRAKSAGDLKRDLAELRREQFSLRMQRGAGQLANPMRFSAVRKDIARIKTVLTEKAQRAPTTAA
ncbi:MAG: 50S ribosomal protein L29 [Gammaproteobacteria bacterium]